jgi:SAM-dependent methyltransferase
MAIGRFQLSAASKVVEIASNDGYLLRNFRARNIPVLGIEPARNVAEVAEKAGVSTRVEFFGTALARQLAGEGEMADLLIGNNVLAHVPALNDFVSAMKILLKPEGVITMEFPHLLRLIRGRYFDTIYHEHFSYFSFLTAEKIFAAHGLELFDVEELSTHGGSLRVYGRHAGASSNAVTDRVERLRRSERDAGLDTLASYHAFAECARETKRSILSLLIDIKRAGAGIVGYGAPAKGNTLLNYCGIGRDFLDYTVDRNPYKQSRFLPGSHIAILAPEAIAASRPEYVLLLPWNLADEIIEQLSYIRAWGGRFIIPLPAPEVVE